MFDNRDFVMALFVVVGAILWIIDRVIQQRSVTALTAALKETRNDPNLIDQGHALATEVVSVDTLHKALDIIKSFSAAAKTIASADVDDAIDAADDLADAIVNDTHTVRGVPVTPLPASETTELNQQ